MKFAVLVDLNMATDDGLHFTYEQWRQKWIDEGMTWSSVKPCPQGWSLKAQLKNIGVD